MNLIVLKCNNCNTIFKFIFKFSPSSVISVFISMQTQALSTKKLLLIALETALPERMWEKYWLHEQH